MQLIRTPGVQPATVHPTRNLAIMHLAIYDAVDAIERIGAPYAKGIAAGKHASAVAAADQAAHDTLVALYPKHQADLDSELRDDLTKIRNSSAERQGIAIGKGAELRISCSVLPLLIPCTLWPMQHLRNRTMSQSWRGHNP